jgi:hypothetical protein
MLGHCHTLPSSGISNVEGDGTYVRVQVLTNAGTLDRAKRLAVVSLFDGRRRSGRRPFAHRADVGLAHQAPEGGWGLAGRPNTNEELVAAARAQIAAPQPKGKP